jgi:hypothetical protein
VALQQQISEERIQTGMRGYGVQTDVAVLQDRGLAALQRCRAAAISTLQMTAAGSYCKDHMCYAGGGGFGH